MSTGHAKHAASKPSAMLGLGYTSITTGTPRVGKRRLFYLFLALFFASFTAVVLVRKWQHRQLVLRRENTPPAPKTLQVPGMEPAQAESKPALSRPDGTSAAATFHPTENWQVIPPGALLPHGLDIKIDFKTGERMARKHDFEQGGPASLPVPMEHPQADAPGAGQDSAAKSPESLSEVDKRLEQILSPDPRLQAEALEFLDLEAHKILIGVAIAKAGNFANLLVLLQHSSSALRLQAAAIIAASTHNNATATKSLLSTTNLVAKIVERLLAEPDANVQRRMVAILTYMSLSDLTETLRQFAAAQGFEALEKINSVQHIDAATFEREMVLLADLSRGEDESLALRALHLLDALLPKATAEFDEVSLDAFRPACYEQLHRKPIQYKNLYKFCKTHVQ